MVESREAVLASVVKQVKEYHGKTGVWLWDVLNDSYDEMAKEAGFNASSSYDLTWDEIKAAVNA